MKPARIIFPLLSFLFLGLFLGSLIWGELPLALKDVWKGLMGQDDTLHTIIWNIRLPRTLVAVGVGAALASSGLMMQAFFKNPLASPGLLGVSSGGALGAVVYIGYGGTLLGMWGLPLASIIGAFLATWLVLRLSSIGLGTERLLLAGIALNALLGAATSFILSLSLSSFERSGQILFWLLGSIDDRTWEHVQIILPLLVLSIFPLARMGSSMNLLSLGEESAQTLGLNVKRFRLEMIIVSTVLAAVATAVAGVIGFVGLVIPHVLRLILGPDHRRLVPASLLGGAIFLLGCDLLTRTLNMGIKVGVLTSLVGAPFFLWLLKKSTA